MEQVAEILQSPNALRVLDVYGSVERITCSHYHFAVSRRSRRQAWCRRELAWSALRVVVTGVILPSLWGSSLLIFFWQNRRMPRREEDRKSTRLNSSHVAISYAVLCLKKK